MDETPGTENGDMIEMIENLMHRDEGVIGWTWRVAVARDYWRRIVGVPDDTVVHMHAAEGVSHRVQKVHESDDSRSESTLRYHARASRTLRCVFTRRTPPNFVTNPP